jgi:hypothetical protein
MSHTMYSVRVGASQRSTEDPLQAIGWATDSGPGAFVTARTPGHGPGTVVWTQDIAQRCEGTLYADLAEYARKAARE